MESRFWANDILRWSIGVLNGKNLVSTDRGRVHIALIMKERLEEEGFWWQAMILEFWIHRFLQRVSADSLGESEEASSFHD